MPPQINAPKHKPKYAIEPNHADRGRGAGVEGQKLGVGFDCTIGTEQLSA